jgi:hypothetical protein
MLLVKCNDASVEGLADTASHIQGGGLLLVCDGGIGPCPELETLPKPLNRERVSAVAARAVDGWLTRLLEAEGILVLLIRDPTVGVPDGAVVDLLVRGSAIVEKATGRAIAVERLTPEYLIHTAKARVVK